MTTCVAVVCDNAETIVLVADRRFGLDYVESDPETSKIIQIHPRWRVMISGSSIDSALEIIDGVTEDLKEATPSLSRVMRSFAKIWQDRRLIDAEAIHLRPIDFTRAEFKKDGRTLLGDSIADEIRQKMSGVEYDVDMIVAGFDEKNVGHIFNVNGRPNRGVPSRKDLPGYDAIGSGAVNAMFFLAYRDMGPKKPLREALLYAFEAKVHGELAAGVGPTSDIFVLTPDRTIEISEKSAESILWKQVGAEIKPQTLLRKHKRLLNKIPELDGFPSLEVPDRKSKETEGTEVDGDEATDGASPKNTPNSDILTPRQEAAELPSPQSPSPDQQPPTASE